MNMSQSCYHIRIMATRKRTADANEFRETYNNIKNKRELCGSTISRPRASRCFFFFFRLRREHENDFKKNATLVKRLAHSYVSKIGLAGDGRRLDVGLQPGEREAQPGEREAQQDERTNDEADVLA